LSQDAREQVLGRFRQDQLAVLVATDVAARGLDVDDITHVINYDLPVEAETYVHRIGRTARAGAEGDAISFCCAEDRAQLRDIERLLGSPVPTEMGHAYHCEDAFNSRQPAVSQFGQRSEGNRGDARPRNKFGRNRNRGRR
jgi:ATP-dependent RNA helicase RhlE